MKRITQLLRPSVKFSYTVAGLGLAVALLSGVVHAQDDSAVEDLEKRVEEQRIALEEAIANREQTAAKAKEVQDALDESEQRRLKVEEELKGLCEEQEKLNAGSYDDCMANVNS